MRRKIKISKSNLIKLYYKEKKSKYGIGRIYNCSFKTVLNRMREYDIKPLPRSIIQSKYKKKNFSGNRIEKAYMIGFRLGDLNVYKTVPHSKVVIARTHTTRIEQVNLLEELFARYGKVSSKKNSKSNSYHVNCFLNKSFEFLLPKEDKIENWIIKDKNYFLSFIAGYVDAEGSFILNQGRGRFRIGSYDFVILKSIKNFLISQGMKVKFNCIAKKGETRTGGGVWNNNLWRFNINDAFSLKHFIELILVRLRHKKRKKDAIKCLENIKLRIKNGTVK